MTDHFMKYKFEIQANEDKQLEIKSYFIPLR